MRFSSSMISKWQTCGLQAKFHYIDKQYGPQSASATFGTCVHEALEFYNDPKSPTHGDVEAAVDRFIYTWDHPEVLDVAPETWNRRTSYGQLKQVGIQCIRDYDAEVAWSNRQVLAVEHRFYVPFGKHFLDGMVDVVEVNDECLDIVDLKSAGKRPTYDTLYMNSQFTVYWYASLQPEFWLGTGGDPEDKYYRPPMENGEELWERFQPEARRRAIWFHLRMGKRIDVGQRDDLDFMRLYRCCDEIEKAIEREVFVPNISAESCLWCPNTDICPLYIPTEEEVSGWS